jgi:hypothetical protein
MSVEIVTTINTLDASFPAATDPRSEGDDHIRNIKSALKTTFPNVAGAVTVSHTALNNIQVTQPTADTSTNTATTAFVKAAIANASAVNLPSTAGNAGKVLTVGADEVPAWGGGTPDFIIQSQGVI